jgi:hypothetical protein
MAPATMKSRVSSRVGSRLHHIIPTCKATSIISALPVIPPSVLRGAHREAHMVSAFGMRIIPPGYHYYEESHLALVCIGSSAADFAYFQIAPSTAVCFCAAASTRIQCPRSLRRLK